MVRPDVCETEDTREIIKESEVRIAILGSPSAEISLFIIGAFGIRFL